MRWLGRYEIFPVSLSNASGCLYDSFKLCETSDSYPRYQKSILVEAGKSLDKAYYE